MCNRLRVLLSGTVMAQATGRDLRMLWPRTPACAAPFAHLFEGEWPVQTVSAAEIADLPETRAWFGRVPDLLSSPVSEVVVESTGWLVRPEQYPHHAPLWPATRALFATLQPTPAIQQQINQFRRDRFAAKMIGVHLRRGDLLRQRPDVAANTAAALAAVDRFLAECPTAGVLLCTDDGAPHPYTGRATPREGVVAQFSARYGARLMTPSPRSLDRSSSVAVQDALTELYLLRACDYFVGTKASTFSDMVVFDRDVPAVQATGAAPLYSRIEWLARKIGLYDALIQQGQREAGRTLPFPVLLHSFVTQPWRWVQRRLGRKHSWRS